VGAFEYERTARELVDLRRDRGLVAVDAAMVGPQRVYRDQDEALPRSVLDALLLCVTRPHDVELAEVLH
jgi:hypothetical protein